jgi:Tol biopolymer transport system component
MRALLGLSCLFLLAGCGPSAFWAPDSKSLAVDLDGHLRTFDLATRQFAHLDTGGRYVVNPTYSPDGRLLVYYAIRQEEGRAGVTDLMVRTLKTNQERPLVEGLFPVPASESSADLAQQVKMGMPLAWSPDGRHLAFVRSGEVTTEVRVLDLETYQAASQNRPGEAQSHPSWSPDGKWLAYLADTDGGTRLWIAQPEGTERHCLWDTARQGDLWPYAAPIWTLDSSSLVVLTARKNPDSWEARVVPVTGSSSRLLSIFTTPLGSVAPDLKSLVYIGGESEGLVVYKRAPFTEPRILDHLPDQGAGNPPDPRTINPFPLLSPDGKTIALPLTAPRRELRLYDTATGAKCVYPVE